MSKQPPGPTNQPQWPVGYTPRQLPQGQFVPSYQPTTPNQRAPQPQPPRPGRMPKAQALSVTKKLKTVVIAGAVMAFGVLTALAAGHITGVTAATAGANSTTSPSHASNSDDNGDFFNQGSSSDNGNAGSFGVSSNAPAQQPAASSSVS